MATVSSESPINTKWRCMLERNIDIFEMAVTETKNYAAEAWFSVRMNDHHYSDDPGFNSALSYERADTLGIDGSRVYLDYTKKEVRNCYREYISELCRNYDIDGIELDFLRSCPVMSCVNEENMRLLTQFIAEVKASISRIGEEKGRQIGLAVRIYPEETANLNYGIDAAGWVASGLLDIVILENWYIPTYFKIPVSKWKESIACRNSDKNPYTILCGTDWAVECDETPGIGRDMWISLEQLKGFASTAYRDGADGIYLFNHFNIDDTQNWGLLTAYIDENGTKSYKRVLKDKIRAVNSPTDCEQGKRVYVNTYFQNRPYPIVLEKSKSFIFEMNTSLKPKTGRFIVVVGIDFCDGNPLEVRVNNIPAIHINDVVRESGFVFKKCGNEICFVDHVSETAERVMQFEASLPSVNDGVNKIEISSVNLPQTIRWIEIQID